MLQVVSTRRLSTLKYRGAVPWVYIGTVRGLAVTACSFSAKSRMLIGRMVQEITEVVRERFTDHVGKTAALQADRVLWYASPLASRSHSQIPTFNYYVYLKVLEALAAREGEDIVVVSDDDNFVHIVGQAGIKGVRLVEGASTTVLRISEVLRGWQQAARHILCWCLSRLLTRAKAARYDVIIFSWIERQTFSDPAGFHDPYLGGLGEWFRQSGLVVGRVTPLLVPLHFAGKLRERFRDLLYPLREVTFFELCRAVAVRLTVALPDDPGVDGRMLHVLMRAEISREERTKAYVSNLLLYYGCRRLFSDLKSTTAVYYPFESQSWEKMFLLALPAHVTRVGYAHTIIPFNWLDHRVSRLEPAAPAPDAILTIGRKWAEFLRLYYPGIPVEVAGGFRQAYLLGKRASSALKPKKGGIVVALPIDPTISMALQTRLLALADQGALAGFTVRIKPHPSLSGDALLTKAFMPYANFSYVEDGISALLEECELLITSASTVAFESLAMSIKTLVYVPESVSWDIEHFIREDVFLAYEDDFSEQFFKALASADSPCLRTEEYFSQPDREIFLKYLKKASH